LVGNVQGVQTSITSIGNIVTLTPAQDMKIAVAVVVTPAILGQTEQPLWELANWSMQLVS
jgi:hypothetical protein